VEAPVHLRRAARGKRSGGEGGYSRWACAARTARAARTYACTASAPLPLPHACCTAYRCCTALSAAPAPLNSRVQQQVANARRPARAPDLQAGEGRGRGRGRAAQHVQGWAACLRVRACLLPSLPPPSPARPVPHLQVGFDVGQAGGAPKGNHHLGRGAGEGRQGAG
jgi:hypothetical protein